MKISDGKINDTGMLMNWNMVYLWGVMIIVMIKGLLMGGDGLINNNRILY